MAINFNGLATTRQYYTGPSITLPDSDWFIVVGWKPSSAGTTFSYPFSTGNFGDINSVNLNVVTGTGVLNANVRGASVQGNISPAPTFVYNMNTWGYTSISREGTNFRLRHCYVNGANTVVAGDYIASVDVTGIGAVTMGPMRLGGRTVDAENTRWMTGDVSQLIVGTGTFTATHLEQFAGGVPADDPYLMRALTLLCWIKNTDSSGNAPLTLTDLSGNDRNFTLTSGVPTLTVNDSASQLSNVYTASGSGVRAIYYNGPSNIQIKGKKATTTSTNTASDAYGIWTRAGSGHHIISNEVTLNAPAGHAVSVGELGGSSISNVVVANNKIRCGNHFGNTPHGLSFRQNTSNSLAFGNLISDTHVGILAALTTSGTARGNVLHKLWGPACYAKGTTNFVFDANVVVVGDGFPMSNNGVLAAVVGETTDCTAVTFSNNIVIVKNKANMKALAQIGGLNANSSAPQPATFLNNLYIFPEEEWDPTEDLFIYTGSISANPNRTYTEWLTINTGGASVTGDRIILLPQAEINKLSEQVLGGAGFTYPTSGSIRIPTQINYKLT